MLNDQDSPLEGKIIDSVVIVVVCVLLAGSLVSAQRVRTDLSETVQAWRSADTRERRQLVFGADAAVVEKVKESVQPQESILLFSSVDPPLYSYALFPRPIYQVNVDPETNQFYMDLPEPSFPTRDPSSFNVDWILLVTLQNRPLGGALQRHQRGRQSQ